VLAIFVFGFREKQQRLFFPGPSGGPCIRAVGTQENGGMMRIKPWSERSALTRLLVIEGEVNSVEELATRLAAEGLLEWASNNSLRAVVSEIVGEGGYKEAARCRQIQGGVNLGEESIEMFRACAERLIRIGGDENLPTITRALALHNAASCLAAWNGVDLDRQESLNERSVELLEQVPEANRGDDWWEAYRKPVVGLFEAGVKAWDPFMYFQIIRRMIENGSKDSAGRLEYFIRRMASDLGAMAGVVLDEELGAHNQRDRLLALMGHLQALVAA